MEKLIHKFTLFCFLINMLFSQQQSAKVLDIVVQGAEFTTENAVRMNSGLYVGQEIYWTVTMAGVYSDDLRLAIQNLWKTGVYSDVKINLLEETTGGLNLEIAIVENPRLNSVVYKGNKKIRKKNLSEVVKLFSGQVLSEYKIQQTKKDILEKYREEKYIRATVEISLEKQENNRSDLIITITENEKVHIGEIRFSGEISFKKNKLKRKMQNTKEAVWYLPFRESKYAEKTLKEDIENLKVSYRNQGYRDIEISVDSVHFNENGKQVSIDIAINEGSQYRFGEFSWDGNTLYKVTQLNAILAGLDISATVEEIELSSVQKKAFKFSLPKLFSLVTTVQSGQKYNKEALDFSVSERLTPLYMNRGHLFFNVVPQEIPRGKDIVDVQFLLSEGSPVFVNEIRIFGNEKTYENVIRRELKILPGDLFTRDALMRSLREIVILDYFDNNVLPNVQPVDDETVDLEFQVQEKEGGTDRANASAGFTQRDGIIGSIGFEFNNFRGRGQKLNLNVQRASYFQTYSFGFTEPWLFDKPNLIGASLFYSERGSGNQLSNFGSSGSSGSYYLPFDVNDFGGTISLGHRFKFPDSYFRGIWKLQVAHKQYSNPQENGRDILFRINPKWEKLDDLSEIRDDPILGINLQQTITRDSRDRAEFPTSGSILSLSSKFAGGLLGGDEDFLKLRMDIQWYFPLFSKFVFYQNTNLGWLYKHHQDSVVPYTEFFFLGGAGLTLGDALRGYDERSIGPINSDGISTGGGFLWLYSAELRFGVSETPTIYSLMFFDAGNTWRTASEANLFDLKRSIGFGGRMFMQMIGEIGFDIGYGFDKNNPGWKSHFIFGRQF